MLNAWHIFPRSGYRGNNSYGISFYKHANKKFKKNWCEKLDRCEYDSFPEKIVNNGKIHVILWKRGNGLASLLVFAYIKTDTFSYHVANPDGTVHFFCYQL
jgi:hypothetical protein